LINKNILLFHVEHCYIIYILHISNNELVSDMNERFFSGGRAWGGSVVSRIGADGAIWSVRVPAAGQCAVSPCLCVPFGGLDVALPWARQVSTLLGWRVVVRKAKRSCGPFEVKVTLPRGLSAGRARAFLPVVP
jgi:hypothetical protein